MVCFFFFSTPANDISSLSFASSYGCPSVKSNEVPHDFQNLQAVTPPTESLEEPSVTLFIVLITLGGISIVVVSVVLATIVVLKKQNNSEYTSIEN